MKTKTNSNVRKTVRISTTIYEEDLERIEGLCRSLHYRSTAEVLRFGLRCLSLTWEKGVRDMYLDQLADEEDEAEQYRILQELMTWKKRIMETEGDIFYVDLRPQNY